MSDLLLGPDGDLADLVKNDLQMATGLQFVGQGGMIRVRFIVGECDLAPDQGCIDFDTVLGKGTDLDRAARVRTTLLGSPGFVSVDRLTVATDSEGVVNVDCEATGTDEPLVLTFEVTPP